MMDPSVNPFNQLVRLARGRRPVPRQRHTASAAAQATTKTGTLIGYLRAAGPAGTLTLGRLIDAESHIVWGLLRAPRQRGEVRYADGLWSAIEEYDARERADILAAASLLRRNGWRVRPPERVE